MTHKDLIFKVLLSPKISEKSSLSAEKHNTVVFKVKKDAKKSTIRKAIQELFKVKVSSINTLLVKEKIKRKGNQVSRHKIWKKAYITLRKGQNVDLLSNVD
ncbi:50S ribosomal protein L23 [Buchnera aphidicola]|uniref:50S ribosomal protein L23 n=1 Tax=Buchnera aphidicola TaxID=9 RepID=UPI0034648C77